MSIGQTAELIADLKLRNGLSGPARQAEGDLTGLNAATNRASAGATSVGRSMEAAAHKTGGLSSALGHARAQIGGLLSGPLGMIGLGATAFGAGALIEQSASKARDLGLATAKLTAITHESVQTASAQLAVFEKYGIDSTSTIRAFGMLEKNLGAITATTKKATEFQKQYGLSVTDAKGNVLSAQDVLLRAADYFKRNGNAAETAAAMGKLFGRSWQAMIPILKLGSQGFLEAQQEAAKLGLTLNAQNAGEIARYIAAQRDLGDAMGALKLQIGLAVIPGLTALAKTITGFLANGGAKQIGDFFRGGVALAGQFARAIGAIAPFFGQIAKMWGSLPEPLRNLMIGGIVASKASSWLFGVNPLGALLGKGANGLGGLFSRGGSPATPMYVADVTGAGGLGGVPGGGGGSAVGRLLRVGGGVLLGFGGSQLLGAGINAGGPGGAGMGALGGAGMIAGGAMAAGPIGAIVGSALAVGQTWLQQNQQSTDQAAALQAQTNKYLATSPTADQLRASLAGVEQGISDLRSNPLNMLVQGDALTRLQSMQADIERQLALAERQQAEGVKIRDDPLLGVLANFLAGFRRTTAAGGYDVNQARITTEATLQHGGLGGSMTTLPSLLKDLERQRAAAARAGDTKAAAEIDKLIVVVRGREEKTLAAHQKDLDRIVSGVQKLWHDWLTGQDHSRPSAPRRDQYRKDDVFHATKEANRDLAARRDVVDMKQAVTSQERAVGKILASTLTGVGQSITGNQSAGFDAVVAAVNAVAGVIAGLPGFGTAAQQGRGTGPGGRPATPGTPSPKVGIEKNRGLGLYGSTLSVTVKADHRTLSSAQVIGARYGATPAQAGAM